MSSSRAESYHEPRRKGLMARGRELQLDRTLVMGVINVTPDSFSDGGLALDPDVAGSRAAELVEQGADLLDVGGMSTRPGSPAVSVEEEKRRVIPALEAISSRCPNAILSVDTSRAAVAAEALDLGVHMINDVRALREAPEIAALCAEHGAALVLMHSTGGSQVMQQRTAYRRFPEDIVEDLRGAMAVAEAAGVEPDHLVVDPGFGFGKTWPQNVALLRGLSKLCGLGAPILVGLSRKSFLGWLTGVERAEARDPGSHAAAVLAVLSGADIVRVHDVAGARQAVAVADAVLRGRMPDPNTGGS